MSSSEALRLEIDTLEQPKPLIRDNDDKDSGKPLLLVIEDNRNMQAYLYQMLSTSYEVELASDGESGLAFALEQIPDMTMSVRQLQRKLKALTDQQPGHYLRLYRLNQSLALLQVGKRIGDVAYLVGFGSPAHFASCFRAQYSCTPTEYQGRFVEVG